MGDSFPPRLSTPKLQKIYTITQMDKAKAAVGSFLHKDGKHDTTVHETVNPAVDREVHQDHHHTSVQPIKDREVLPEQHNHQMAGVETRNLKHGNDEHVKERLAAEQAQFKNARTVGDTQHTSSANPTIAGEHVHHHVHENIQPVIQKETIQPSVVHTTVPVHDVHQNEAKHHTATSLPAVTMDEFKNQGGHISGRDERTDAFAGEPRSVGGTLGGAGAHGTTSLTEKDGHHKPHDTHGTHSTHGTGAGVGGTGLGSSTSHSSSNTTGAKPGLMDKLNPKKDADGDGKAGFMK